AELFAISIRDYNKGILIGQNTYGKGVMQTTYSLDDGSSVKFTVGQFFSKSKTDFSDGGIIPDVMFELNEHERTHYYLLKDQDNPYIKKAVEWFNENE
ncbi:MAG: S41 family peptidase, partial [Ruminococcaceae bacterium]|nr:S41 family peptidase [Oscillospiraceae bacterium]